MLIYLFFSINVFTSCSLFLRLHFSIFMDHWLLPVRKQISSRFWSQGFSGSLLLRSMQIYVLELLRWAAAENRKTNGFIHQHLSFLLNGYDLLRRFPNLLQCCDVRFNLSSLFLLTCEYENKITVVLFKSCGGVLLWIHAAFLLLFKELSREEVHRVSKIDPVSGDDIIRVVTSFTWTVGTQEPGLCW